MMLGLEFPSPSVSEDYSRVQQLVAIVISLLSTIMIPDRLQSYRLSA